MANYKFLHVAVSHPFPLSDDKRAAIETALNDVADWLRYASNCWLIWTSRDPQELATHLKTILTTEHDAFLIVEVNMNNFYGWLVPKAWEWVQKPRQPS